MKKLVICTFIGALLSPMVCAAQGQPASWNYSFLGGISTANYPGNISFGGPSGSSNPSGTFGASSQILNSAFDIIALNDQYHDNVLTVQNLSVGNGTIGPAGACGVDALRFRDSTSIPGVEHAAFGYANPTSAQVASSPCSASYDGGNVAFVEVSNNAGSGNPANGSFAINFSDGAGAPTFPNSYYEALQINGVNNHTYINDHTGRGAFEFDPEGNYFTVHGTDTIASLQFHSGTETQPASINCSNSDGSSCATAIYDYIGAGVFLVSYGQTALQAQNGAGAVNWTVVKGSSTGQPIGLVAAGTDANIDFYLQPKGTGVTRSSSVFRPPSATYANISTIDGVPAVGDEIVISDASACTANTAVTAGGGTTHSCAVVDNGAGWIALVTH